LEKEGGGGQKESFHAPTRERKLTKEAGDFNPFKGEKPRRTLLLGGERNDHPKKNKRGKWEKTTGRAPRARAQDGTVSKGCEASGRKKQPDAF